MTTAESFWARVDIRTPDVCWPWQGHRKPKGYGTVSHNGTTTHAHRLAWVLTFGDIPAGLRVCHACDNTSCCNPQHLMLGSDQANELDKVAKGRHYKQKVAVCPAGHEYTEGTTRYNAYGTRFCGVCHPIKTVWKSQTHGENACYLAGCRCDMCRDAARSYRRRGRA